MMQQDPQEPPSAADRPPGAEHGPFTEHGRFAEHVVGCAEVRGRRAECVWDGQQVRGDPELVTRLERATAMPPGDSRTFLAALRAVGGQVVAVDVGAASGDGGAAAPDPTTPGPEPIDPLPDVPDPVPDVPGTDHPPPVQPEPLAAA
jgi:hypothetical protein